MRNVLLEHMAADDFALIHPFLVRVHYPVGAVIAEPGQKIESVYFPEGGVVALLTIMTDATRLAVGLIGCEGMVGASMLHGAGEWRHEIVNRAADSSALSIDADRLRDACRQSHHLHDLLLRFAGYFLQQVGRTSVANLVEPLERRMARWLLLYHDRLPDDEIAITHQEISIMLGCRRASATDIMHILEGAGAIRSVRGRVRVRDRALLESIAGEIYGDAEADYRQQIGPFGKSPAIPASIAVGALATG